ncbi:MAG TPA: peptidoglycan recognition protein, partial [Kineosporiaceae bacterium]|nr:peptidoglycan recognition protein [Kineosporiaceae bacterium]
PPPIVSRAGWQADESIRRAAPTYSSAARVMFVHHTTSSNGYDCSQSPAIIRGEYAYHALSLGWNDIGYNFLVDKCGTVYEGRYGGIDRPVIGAQTYGFNTNSAGIAVIGTYTGTSAPPAVLASVARLAAWKLSLAGLSPTGTSTLVESASDSHGFIGGRSYVLPTISGHRDGYATECPGDALYAQLPALRSLAATDGGPFGPVVTVTGANAANGRYYTTGRATVTWSAPSSEADITDYTVLVDGRVAATSPPDVRTATLTLPPGTHTVTVRATYRSSRTNDTDGTSGSPTTSPTTTPPTSGTAPTTATTTATTATTAASSALDSVPVTVIADVTQPAFASPPRLGLRQGTVNDTGVPVSLAWRATDNAYLARVTASSPTRATFTAAATTWAATVVPGLRTYALIATDGAGNTRTATVSGRTTLMTETAATRKGSWTRNLSTSYLGGSALSSRTKGNVISWSFTGTAVSWIATRTKASGQAVVYLDGVNAGTVDLASAHTSFRQSVWTRSGLPAKRHTVTVVIVATKTRPTVITDGIAYLSAK